MPILQSLFPRLRYFYSTPTTPFLSFFTPSNIHTLTPYQNPDQDKSILLNYLEDFLGFSKSRALFILNHSSSLIKTNPNPQSVVQFFKDLDLSDAQIRSAVTLSPKILFSNVNESLKPRIQFFQELGLTGPNLCKFISKHSFYLTDILFERLVPCVQIIKKVMTNDCNNEKLFQTLRRCNWVRLKDPESRLSANISYLESCGIVGSQLGMIMSRQPRLLIMQNSELKNLVSRVLDMGFFIDSRMLVHAVYTVSCLSSETFARKFNLFRSFGFSEVECKDMFRRDPGLLRVSEGKLKDGIEFFMDTMKFEKSILVHRPDFLMYSLEERVIPRFRVLEIMKSKNLLKKEPRFTNVMTLSEGEFLNKFVLRFPGAATEELLVAYKVGC